VSGDSYADPCDTALRTPARRSGESWANGSVALSRRPGLGGTQGRAIAVWSGTKYARLVCPAARREAERPLPKASSSPMQQTRLPAAWGRPIRSNPPECPSGGVPVAAVHAVCTHLAVAGAAHSVDLGRHQPLGETAHHLSQQVAAVRVEVFTQPLQRVHVVGGDRVSSRNSSQDSLHVVVVASGGPPALPARPIHHNPGLKPTAD
jgi:hypothetical protein